MPGSSGWFIQMSSFWLDGCRCTPCRGVALFTPSYALLQAVRPSLDYPFLPLLIPRWMTRIGTRRSFPRVLAEMAPCTASASPGVARRLRSATGPDAGCPGERRPDVGANRRWGTPRAGWGAAGYRPVLPRRGC